MNLFRFVADININFIVRKKNIKLQYLSTFSLSTKLMNAKNHKLFLWISRKKCSNFEKSRKKSEKIFQNVCVKYVYLVRATEFDWNRMKIFVLILLHKSSGRTARNRVHVPTTAPKNCACLCSDVSSNILYFCSLSNHVQSWNVHKITHIHAHSVYVWPKAVIFQENFMIIFANTMNLDARISEILAFYMLKNVILFVAGIAVWTLDTFSIHFAIQWILSLCVSSVNGALFTMEE